MLWSSTNTYSLRSITSSSSRMRPHIASLFTFFSATLSVAQNVVEETSFGYGKGISPNSFAIPGWQKLGEGHDPQLLSDKVIVTPPYGGNKRGALWAENKNLLPEWTVDLDFRAGGQERAGGNLQLWYANDGQSAIGTSSIYTVGKFDGLALVVDTRNGRQSIRGFLNDGTTEYRSHSSVDSLAFGHCDYAYRNLGRPSTLRLKSGSNGLEVLIDENPCFSSDKVMLPKDFYFGITAASSDPPDSFEVFKFLLKQSYDSPPSKEAPPPSHNQVPIQNNGQYQQAQIPQPAALPASHFTSSAAQFEELHNRLGLLSKSITNLFAEITKHTSAEEARYQEIIRLLAGGQDRVGSSSVDQRLQNIQAMLSEVKREIDTGDHKGQFASLNQKLGEMNVGVTEHLPNRVREFVADHAPRVGFMITCFMLFQCVLVVAYVLYKRRRANAPKKYL